MKSTIDWNEIVPLLSKEKRENLYLDAVIMLSQDNPKRTFTRDRKWGNSGIKGGLCIPGRKYKINRDKVHHFTANSKARRVWELLSKSNNDTITYEGLASLAKGQALQPDQAVNYLWCKELIDVA